jgi:hypothetical protein
MKNFKSKSGIQSIGLPLSFDSEVRIRASRKPV